MISIALHKDTQLTLTEFQKDFIHHLNMGNLNDIMPFSIPEGSYAIPNYPLWAFYDWDFFKTDKLFEKATLEQPVFEGNKIIFPLTIETQEKKTVQTHIHFATIINARGPQEIKSAAASVNQDKHEKHEEPNNEMLQLSSDDAFWSKLSEKKEEVQSAIQEEMLRNMGSTQSSPSENSPNISLEEKSRKVYASRFLFNFPLDIRLLKKGTCLVEKNNWSLYDECWLKKKGQEPEKEPDL